ncbi:hypothetical protein [uncultured Microscilla sp.]|uniref:hypothetical protein n=1 Tax=uncultured Microscilla sp. TaxID=432653 RepID=UPI0026308A4A|nr:hypothetical protein [uncultured Microscilla sp.]
MNDRTNYILTEDGVINKIDSYWEELNELSDKQERLGRDLLKKLFGHFSLSLVAVISVLWVNVPHSYGVIALAVVSLATLASTIVQINTYVAFVRNKKHGMILYQELSQQIVHNYENSLERRVTLSKFLLSCTLPLHPYLYMFLLASFFLVITGSTIFYNFYL